MNEWNRKVTWSTPTIFQECFIFRDCKICVGADEFRHIIEVKCSQIIYWHGNVVIYGASYSPELNLAVYLNFYICFCYFVIYILQLNIFHTTNRFCVSMYLLLESGTFEPNSVRFYILVWVICVYWIWDL